MTKCVKRDSWLMVRKNMRYKPRVKLSARIPLSLVRARAPFMEHETRVTLPTHFPVYQH